MSGTFWAFASAYKYLTMKYFPCVGFLLIVLCVGTKLAAQVVPTQDLTAKGWQLVWSDEFDVDGLPDSSRWSYDVGDGCPEVCGWGNAEEEYYMAHRLKNARVESGLLLIEAHQEAMGGKPYTSAKLVTRESGSWTYGRIAVRAKLPTGRGTWPAIWMMPITNTYGGWPHSGEIDIMEHVGYNPRVVYGTVHTGAFNTLKGTQRGDSLEVPDAEATFRVYEVIWDQKGISYFIDGNAFHYFPNESQTFEGKASEAWPFDHPFYLILNLAVGGHWGGKHGVDLSIWPQRFEIDYVRIYQQTH